MPLNFNFVTNTYKAVRGAFDRLEEEANPSLGVLQYPTDGDNFDAGHFIMFHINEQVKGTGVVASAFKRGVREFAANPFANSAAGKGLFTLNPFGGILGAALVAGGVEFLKDNLAQTPEQVNIIGRGRTRIQKTRQALAEVGASTSQRINNAIIPIQMETVGSVLLYMPEKITTNYGFDYQGESLQLAVAGLGLADIAGSGSMLSEEVKAEFMAGLAEQFSLRFVTKILDDLGSFAGINVGATGTLEKKRRKVLNPHMQFLFKSVNQRSFEYTFSFAPRNEKDSEAIDNIIRTFKFYSHPEIQNGGLFHGYPAEFDIQYIARENKEQPYAENDWLNKVGRCYLSGVAVDYSAAGVFSTFRGLKKDLPDRFRGTTPSSTSRQGNPPTHINLTLTFNELETLNRAHIAEGF